VLDRCSIGARFPTAVTRGLAEKGVVVEWMVVEVVMVVVVMVVVVVDGGARGWGGMQDASKRRGNTIGIRDGKERWQSQDMW
jgi:hypothetical protein